VLVTAAPLHAPATATAAAFTFQTVLGVACTVASLLQQQALQPLALLVAAYCVSLCHW
jgi:hypothetical protein